MEANMEQDPELLDAFAQEISQLEEELGIVVESLKQNIDQPQAFEKFGQLIDRIYGTAATFGFTELATYSGALKKTCYDCSVTINKRAYPRVLNLLDNCMTNLSTLKQGIHNPEIVKEINRTLHLETQRTKKLFEEIFQFDKVKSRVK